MQPFQSVTVLPADFYPCGQQ